MSDPSDTIPVPKPSIDADVIDAVVDDLGDLIAAIEGAALNLANLRSGLRRQAADARGAR